MHLKTKELNNEIQNDDSKNRFYVVRGPIWDRKIVKVKKTKKINNSSGSKQQLKVWYSNADVLTTDKLNELKGQIDCDYSNIVCIAEVIKTLSELYLWLNTISMAMCLQKSQLYCKLR